MTPSVRQKLTEDEQIIKTRARFKKVTKGHQKVAASLDAIFTLVTSYGTRLKKLQDEQEEQDAINVANDLQFTQLRNTVSYLQGRVQERAGKLNVDPYFSVHD